jgi:rhodanese-related sulfurtransferase
MNGTVVVVVLVLVVALFLFVRPRPDTDGEQARELVQGGAKLIDVRSDNEFSAGHIEGAVNIPVHQLQLQKGQLGDKSNPIVVYCASGARSTHAKKLLESWGFTQVHNLGAMGRW